MNARSVMATGALLIAAIGSWYLAGSYRNADSLIVVTESSFAGFYLRSVRILGPDEDGTLLYEIEAEFAEQQENNDIELQDVRIRYSPATNVPWTITADFATISDQHDLIRLSGHVVAVSEEGFAGQVTEIRAAVLDIDPNLFRAETDGKVQIRIGSRSLTATGMLALLQESRLHLKSNVSGKFVP